MLGQLTIVKYVRAVTHHLLGVAEIAELLGVSRQRVHQLAARDDFPRPTAELSAGKVWDAAAIERWQAASGRSDTSPAD